MSAVEEWSDSLADLERKLAEAKRQAEIAAGQVGSAALDAERRDTDAGARLKKAQREREAADARVRSLELARKEAEARAADAKTEEQAAARKAREEKARELCAQVIAGMKKAQAGLDMLAEGLNEAETARAELRKLRRPRDRVAALSDPNDPGSVSSRLHSYGGSLGLDRWLTDSAYPWRQGERRSLVESEQAALERYLAQTVDAELGPEADTD